MVDEKNDAALLFQLESLGLSAKESSVYLSLVPRQDTGTSKLIRATGLHGQFVYAALGKLEAMGLAKHVIKNGRKKFSANTPQRLLSLVDEKRLTAQAVARELQNRFAGRHEQDFEVYRGESAFIAHQIDLLRRAPQGATWDAIASAMERYRATFEAYGMLEELDALRREKDVMIRYLGGESQRAKLVERKKNWFNWTYRIFPGLEVGLISIEIVSDTVSFVVYGDEILCFTLTSAEIADGYRAFFETLWNLATE